MLFIWIFVFVVALIALVKGADLLIDGAEKIGLALGFSPFIIGVTIVGIGTSLPELISSFVATINGVNDLAVANAVGSNIANILLIIGLLAVIGRRIVVTKNLIDLDLPLLAIGTILFLGMAWDKQITFGEAVLLLIGYGVYFSYTILHKDTERPKGVTEVLPPQREEKDDRVIHLVEESHPSRIARRDIVLFIVGVISLVLGAKYLVEAVVQLATMLHVATGLIAITAVAFGTSLPELFVSARAALLKKADIAVGNVLGSNVFNTFVVVGFPGLFHVLSVDAQTFAIGIPAMVFATFLFVISGISRNIYIWEGIFFLAAYALFLAKLFQWF